MPLILPTIDLIPPFMAVLLSKGMTLRVIASKSGIPLRSVIRLATRKTWRGVKPEVMDAFTTACGVDLLQPGPHKAYLRATFKKHRPLRHWSRARVKRFGELASG